MFFFCLEDLLESTFGENFHVVFLIFQLTGDKYTSCAIASYYQSLCLVGCDEEEGDKRCLISCLKSNLGLSYHFFY